MTTRYCNPFACAFVAAALALPLQASALRIEGLPPFEPVEAAAVTPTVADGVLHVALSQDHMLRVAPWPKFLPQHFGKQALVAARQMLPAGPYDRLAFNRVNAKQPWLVIGTGARRSTAVVGAWRVQLSGVQWSVAQGKQRRILGDSGKSARPATVAVGKDRWCIYLLDSSLPPQQSGIAAEREPQMSFAALRLDAPQKPCPAQ